MRPVSHLHNDTTLYCHAGTQKQHHNEDIPFSSAYHLSIFFEVNLFRTAFLIPRVKTAFDEWQVFWLTPYPEAFPMFQIRHQWQKMFPRYINGASQQRDCLGLTPNSLLIRMTRIFIRNQFGTKIKKKTERGRIINKKCKIQSHSASSIIDILTFCHLVFSMWLVAHFSESVPGLSGKSAVFTILQKQKNIREHIFQAN